MRLEKHRFLRVAWMLLAFVPVSPAKGRCFDPLLDRTSRDTKAWSTLVTFTPTNKPAGVEKYLTIATNGYGDRINLDYYEITFAKDPNRTIVEYFRVFRQRFEAFTSGYEVPDPLDIDAPSRKFTGNEFHGYQASPSANDPSLAQNEALWASADPKGALMTFVLRSYSHSPVIVLRATADGQRLGFVAEQGDVVATCTSDTDFVFSTAKTKDGGYHPVSGNRGFGIKDNGDGTWTFYTQGADRETKLDSVNVPYPLPRLASRGDADAVFLYGDQFWHSFFGSIRSFLDRRGQKVVDVFLDNSRRYPYPLPRPVSVHVTRPVFPVSQQPKLMGCWAASAAMIWGWKNNQVIGMQELAHIAGPNYETILQQDTGLTMAESDELVRALGLHAEAPMSYSIEGLATLLRTNGPLWFMATAAPMDNVPLHARVVTDIEGDGTLDGTNIVFIDPFTGTASTETFRIAMEKYEMVVTGRVANGAGLPIQIYHP